MLLTNEITTKLRQATTDTSPAEVDMVAIFAEDMIAAREYIKTTYPKSQKRGTFRLYNAEDKVCYDIISTTNNNFQHNYIRAAYFDGKRLVKLNELVSNFNESVEETEHAETEHAVEKPIITVTSTLEMPANDTDTIPVWQAAFMKKKGTVNNGENE